MWALLRSWYMEQDGEHRRPKVLYLADRNFLVDDSKDRTFASMGDAGWKIQRYAY
ncbi:MAG TPA: hypothetical protein VIO11_00595 [Candidatus Methanoperedens sp.]